MKLPSDTESGARRRFRSWIVLNLVLLAVVGALSLTYPVEELSRRFSDILFRLRRPPHTSDAVALVLIDDLSLSRYGRWPWPRPLLARLVRATAAQKPRAIGLDILLSESETSASDGELASSFREAGNVVLATKIASSPNSAWSDPLPVFLKASAGLGHVQAVEDGDGICRSVPAAELSLDGPRRALALELASVAGASPGPAPPAPGPASAGASAGSSPSTWRSYKPEFLIVDYRPQYVPGRENPPFEVISAARLLAGERSPALLGKAVLIGFGATELSDRLPTPVSGQMPMPGVEVHANLTDQIMRGVDLRPVGALSQAAFLVVFCLVSTWLVLRWPGWNGVLWQVALLAVSYGISYALFAFEHRLFAFGPVLFAGILAVPLAQLENLILVNRGLTRGLNDLQRALDSSPKAPELAGFQTARASAPEDDLQQRLDLIHKMQFELSALYSFRQLLLESMHEGLAVFTSAGAALFQNRAWDVFCAAQGWDPQLSLGEFGRELGHPSWADMPHGLETGAASIESEVYLGGGFWQVRGAKLAPDDKQATQWMVVVSDLTSRLERDRARAEALRFVTHELRTPLVSIQGFAEFLQRYPDNPGSGDAAATIFRESQRLVSLINTYLDVLRFDAGARSLRREPVRIAEMIGQVERVMSPIADAAGIHITVRIAPALPVLVGDEPMISGVILNLLNNAVKYSPAASDVSLEVVSEGPQIVFEVQNPGPPIPPEDLASLFEPFYRARPAGDATPGWGLGLTFVKRAVEEHHGTIVALSQQGKIRVRVALPSTAARNGSARPN